MVRRRTINVTVKNIFITDAEILPLVRQTQLKFHMQSAWIRMRCRVTLCLIQIQAVRHLDNIFTNFE